MTTAYMLAGGGAHELLTYGADIAFTFPFTLLRSQNNKLLHIMMSSSSRGCRYILTVILSSGYISSSSMLSGASGGATG